MMIIKAISLVWFLQSATTISGQERLVDYGVDVSYPMHYADISKNYDWLPHNLDPSLETPEEYVGREVQHLGDKQTFYDNLLQGCVAHYDKKGFICQETENDRIAMNLRQPKSMLNYTQLGFTKIRAPTEVFELLKEFWNDNRDRAEEEEWSTG
jgi:prolyl 4-hydroxylase